MSLHENSALDPSRSTGLANPAPFLALLDELRGHSRTYAAITPHIGEAQCLEYVCQRLERAINESRRVDVWLTIEQLAHLVNRPQSTLRALCSKHREAIGAYKQRGSWTIHWPRFEEFWTHKTEE
jgi:hypothetical protein